jgi:hypothetical protein
MPGCGKDDPSPAPGPSSTVTIIEPIGKKEPRTINCEVSKMKKPNKPKKIRTEFEHWYGEEKVLIKCSCKDVQLDEVEDLRFAFFDEDGNPMQIEFDIEEYDELQNACIEKLSDAKDEMLSEQLLGEEEPFFYATE